MKIEFYKDWLLIGKDNFVKKDSIDNIKLQRQIKGINGFFSTVIIWANGSINHIDYFDEVEAKRDFEKLRIWLKCEESGNPCDICEHSREHCTEDKSLIEIKEIFGKTKYRVKCKKTDRCTMWYTDPVYACRDWNAKLSLCKVIWRGENE